MKNTSSVIYYNYKTYKAKMSEQKKPSLFDKKIIQILYEGQNITGCGILHLHEAIFKILGL